MKKTMSIITITIASILLVGCQAKAPVSNDVKNENLNQQEIVIDACDLSGNRKSNVKVDIGYGDRQYYAFTNVSGQLIHVEAAEISSQKNEELKKENKGRYCPDEAKVPGTEKPNLDEGHIIADSLGGVSNAYNITPQESKVNRSGGKQYAMETELQEAIRSKKKVTDFVADIEYPSTQTQTPSKYKYSVKINGQVKHYEFENKE